MANEANMDGHCRPATDPVITQKQQPPTFGAADKLTIRANFDQTQQPQPAQHLHRQQQQHHQQHQYSFMLELYHRNLFERFVLPAAAAAAASAAAATAAELTAARGRVGPLPPVPGGGGNESITKRRKRRRRVRRRRRRNKDEPDAGCPANNEPNNLGATC